jgi:hypothetical protein
MAKPNKRRVVEGGEGLVTHPEPYSAVPASNAPALGLSPKLGFVVGHWCIRRCTFVTTREAHCWFG